MLIGKILGLNFGFFFCFVLKILIYNFLYIYFLKILGFFFKIVRVRIVNKRFFDRLEGGIFWGRMLVRNK